MKPVSYVTAKTPASAVELARDDGRFLAGGMDLLGELKDQLINPKTLVNVKALPGLGEVKNDGGTWSIGANVTLAMLSAHIGLQRAVPGLTDAAAEVGSPQIRNVATVGGNLAQHSRCWYYRHPDVQCRKKGGKTCFARQGESKYHSLFTGCMCASPCVSNLAIALSALDARIVVWRGRKTETFSVAQLYADAWRMPAAHNSLRAEDLILRVELAPTANGRSAFLQIAEKSDFDWALVSCAAAARVEGGKLSHVRIVLGAVAPIPWQVDEANAMLEGKTITPELAASAADVMLHDAQPLGDNAYKLPIAKALVRRTLFQLLS